MRSSGSPGNAHPCRGSTITRPRFTFSSVLYTWAPDSQSPPTRSMKFDQNVFVFFHYLTGAGAPTTPAELGGGALRSHVFSPEPFLLRDKPPSFSSSESYNSRGVFPSHKSENLWPKVSQPVMAKLRFSLASQNLSAPSSVLAPMIRPFPSLCVRPSRS